MEARRVSGRTLGQVGAQQTCAKAPPAAGPVDPMVEKINEVARLQESGALTAWSVAAWAITLGIAYSISSTSFPRM